MAIAGHVRSAVLCRQPDLQINPVTDGCVVYQPDLEHVHFLNQTATMALGLCNGHNRFREIEEEVIEACGIPRTGRMLVSNALRRFIGEGLVTQTPPPRTRVESVTGSDRKISSKLNGYV